MQVIALVDYDNVKPYGKETSSADTFAQINQIIEMVTQVRREFCPTSGEMIIRLYGGWIDELGVYTQLANWLLPQLSLLRGRRNGVRIRIELVTSLAAVDDIHFVGTYRRSSRPAGQKMVDTMMGIDLIHLSSISHCPIILFSDDDDLVPSLLYVARTSRPCALSRKREKGVGINDTSLLRHKIEFFLHGL